MTASHSNIESEYIDINTRKAWPVLFQNIRIKSNEMASNFKCLEAKKPQNKILNRYRDVNPYDHSRVVLHRGSCDYINANLVKVQKANREYILTQGPLQETVGHFWLMIWEQKSIAILMLNKLVENRQVKCHYYWPDDIGPDSIMYFNDVGLKLEYVSFEDYSYYTKRLFKLMDMESNSSREIIQFHYTTWPDFGVPTSPTIFLEFLKVVRESGALESNVGPAVVHCSAGIGRSGTFCLVDSCLILIEKYGINSVDVKEVLLEMRRYRMGLIQTPDQLRFSYEAIIEGAKRLMNPNSDSGNENNIYEIVNNENDEEDEEEEDENEPPPLPPPRGESLSRSHGPASTTTTTTTTLFDRPLPTIPTSESMNEFVYNEANRDADIANSNIITNGPPNRPLPGLPQEDDMTSSDDEPNISSNSTGLPNDGISPTELRQRIRVEKQEKLAAKVQEMKRKQQSAEAWENTKRHKSASTTNLEHHGETEHKNNSDQD